MGCRPLLSYYCSNPISSTGLETIPFLISSSILNYPCAVPDFVILTRAYGGGWINGGGATCCLEKAKRFPKRLLLAIFNSVVSYCTIELCVLAYLLQCMVKLKDPSTPRSRFSFFTIGIMCTKKRDACTSTSMMIVVIEY